MSRTRTATLTAGILTLILSLGMLAVGGAIWTGYAAHRDVDGFVESTLVSVHTEHAAVLLDEAIRGTVEISPADGLPTGTIELRVNATSSTGKPLFVGVAPSEDVRRFLSSVPHDRIVTMDDNGLHVHSEPIDSGSVTDPNPLDVPWIASSSGSVSESVTWDASPGGWSVVIMNDDGSSFVAADVVGAVRSDPLTTVGIGLVLAGLVGAGIGVVLVLRRSSRAAIASHRADATVAEGPPVLLEARLDPDLSRWTWLVKWILAIPHAIVLVFLWLAFVVLTVVAFFAILATGRYPRAIFDINVGILRWTWRVGFYAFTAIGTDRYPPFTLADTDYPARLDIAYPRTLSRGLVLVKSWLLALPHLIVVGVLTTGIIWWVYEPVAGGASVRIGGGVIGILVVVAGIALVVSGRYPAVLFDLIIGLNRWVYRVIAYVALMRDEYPPFRLDMGGTEPFPPTDEPTAGSPVRAQSAGTK